jgi:uncharacterized protein YpmB
MKKRTAFTLLEIMLAITIIVLIIGTVFAFYTHSAKIAEAGRKKLNDLQLARVILFKITSELRAVTTSGSRFNYVLKGDSEHITLMTTVIPSKLVYFPHDAMDSGRVIEHDLRLVEYTLARSEDNDDIILGLRRDELRCLLTTLIEEESSDDLNKTDVAAAEKKKKKFDFNLGIDSSEAFSEQPVITQEIISDRIKYLNFDYYNGTQWVSKWNPSSASALPRAVRVTVGFKEVPEEEKQDELLLQPEERTWHDDQYSLTVSLILSDEIKNENVKQEEGASK